MNEKINKYFAEINNRIISSCNRKIKLDVEIGKMGYMLK